MNYIREINAFYDWLETNRLSLSAIALWHALLHINNKAAWTDEFAVALSVLCAKTSLSPRGVTDARNELKMAGRIIWRSRKGNQSAIYHLISLTEEMQATIADKCADNATDKCADKRAGNTATLNKHKQNINETENNNPSLPDTTENERQVLNQLKNILNYPFDSVKDLVFIRELVTEFTTVDLFKESKKYATWILDNPIRKKSNPRLQFRNWCEKANDWNKQPARVMPVKKQDKAALIDSIFDEMEAQQHG